MPQIELIHESLTRSVIGAFFEVYNTLGYGFLEHVYVSSLERELRNTGHDVGREVSVPVFYKGEQVAHQRLDMIVDGKLVVEIKSTRALHEGAVRQVANYLTATNLEVGLLLHFGPRAKFFRVVHNKSDKRRPRMSSGYNPQNPRNPRNPSVSVASRNANATDEGA
jgi:GxxExxY protein